MDSQAASRIVLDDGTVLTKCDQCRQMYAERKPPGTPPCESCRVELKEENREVARIYMETRGQVITAGMGDVVDINILAVMKLMDLYAVKNPVEVLSRIRKTFYHFLSETKKNHESI